MRARRTPSCNEVLRLPGASEDNALHVRVGPAPVPEDDPCHGAPSIASVWEPDQEERAAISAGANLELVVMGTAHPPVSLAVTREQPTSRPQRGDLTPRVWTELPRATVEDLVAVLDDAIAGEPLPDDRAARLGSLRLTLGAGLEVLERDGRP